MARFYGTVKGKAGSRGTREGTEASGIEVAASGWNVGVRVICKPRADKASGKSLDECRAYLTGGSNEPRDIQLLGIVEEAARKGDKPHVYGNR